MKSNIVMFGIITAYFLIVTGVYVTWNLVVHQRLEWAGSIALLLSGALCAFIASYLALAYKKQGGELVSDVHEADIDDGDPEMGEFSPWSWWPISLAFAVALVVLGLCIGQGFWLSFLAIPLVPVAVVGWIYEYYRGHFAR